MINTRYQSFISIQHAKNRSFEIVGESIHDVLDKKTFTVNFILGADIYSAKPVIRYVIDCILGLR